MVGILIFWGIPNQVEEALIEYPEIERKPLIVLGNSVVAFKTSFFASKLPVLASIVPEWYQTTPQTIKRAENIILCESGGKNDVWGKYGEFGIAQFKEKTFYWMADLAGLENPNWKDEKQQVYLLLWALDNGLAKKHWTCYKE